MNLNQTDSGRRHRLRVVQVAVVFMSLIAGVTCLSGETNLPLPIMKSFVIIFRQGPVDSSDEIKARRQQEIVAWAAKHQAAGHRLEPRALEIDVRRPGITAPGDVFAWPIVALVFLEARDIEEAAAIADDHPAKNYNVSTEVRPWTARKVPEATSRSAK